MSRFGERYRFDWRLRLAVPLAMLALLNTTAVLAGRGGAAGLLVGLTAAAVAAGLVTVALRADGTGPGAP